MADYVKSFGPNFVGLTGSPEAIAAAAKAYRVAYAKVENKDSAGDYSVDHSALVYLMDPRRQIFDAFCLRHERRGNGGKAQPASFSRAAYFRPRPFAIAPQHKITISVCDAASVAAP